LLNWWEFPRIRIPIRNSSILSTPHPGADFRIVIYCKNCIHWIDETLSEIEADTLRKNHIFMGCRVYGDLKGNYHLTSCKEYRESENLFSICNTCQITVPKICISLGECINCTDTDLFCIENCFGRDNRKYCTHFVRLHSEGIKLIDNDQVFDLFPNKPMPGRKKVNRSG